MSKTIRCMYYVWDTDTRTCIYNIYIAYIYINMVWNERNFQKPTTRPPTGPHKMSLAATVSPQFKLASGTWCKPWQNRFLSSPIWVFCSLMFMVDGRFKGFHGGGWENQNGPAGTNQPFNWTIHICFKNKASSRIQNDPNANLVIFYYILLLYLH